LREVSIREVEEMKLQRKLAKGETRLVESKVSQRKIKPSNHTKSLMKGTL